MLKKIKYVFIALIILPFSYLPLSLLQSIGSKVGKIALRLSKKRWHIARRNIEVCFPELSSDEKNQLLTKVGEESGKWFFESGYVWHRKPELLRRKVRVKNPELLDTAYKKNKGVIIVLPHLGNFEFINYYIPFLYPFGSMYRPFNSSSFVEKIILRGRSRVGTTMFSTNAEGVRGAYKHLKAGKILAVLADHLPSRKSGVFAPFFGKPAHTGRLTHALARYNQSEVLLAAVMRLPSGGGFEITFSELPNLNCETPVESATHMNLAIESAIRLAPEQYQWVYQRFSRQPDGEPKVY
ncbi:MAG: KDO2-lipid IV(A) lauroyltransferase [Cellvibrionaceae bacterium]|jgi:KDO2-lipid IV(A) lauroyltransferase